MNKFCFLFFIFIYTPLAAQIDFQDSNLPIILIETNGQQIVDEPKVFSSLKVIYNGPINKNQITDTPNDYDGYASIELRGQSSQALFEKKSYGIELRTANNEDLAANLLGMPEEEDWVLHGPYSDKSLLRNFLTFHLWSQMDRYGSRTKLCEVAVNGDYKGVYILMEKIKRDSARVNISKLKPDEVSGDDLTGGYIVKIDKINPGELVKGWTSAYKPPRFTSEEQNILFQMEYPKPEEITEEQFEYIRSYIGDFEKTLAGPDFKDPVTGFRAYADAGSFIDYQLLTELTRNVDGYRLSTFMYKDKNSDGGKLKMGPPWDYNLAFGNADYCRGSNTSGWAWNFNHVCDYDYWLLPFWWSRLIRDERYVDSLKTRWNELRKGPFATAIIHEYIDSVALVLNEAQQRNFQRWPVLSEYVWPNTHVGATYQDEINYLKSWVKDRMEWMDKELNRMQVVLGNRETIIVDLIIYPNPASNKIRVMSTYLLSSYQILDLQGKVHLKQLTKPREILDVDISSLKSGLYTLKGTDEDENVQLEQVFIKE